jgi:hypothetical protein
MCFSQTNSSRLSMTKNIEMTFNHSVLFLMKFLICSILSSSDHDDDCGDGSDEPRNCTYTQCTSSQFKCDNLRCISESLKCNGRNDCFDNSDEKHALCVRQQCPPGQFTCNNGNCTMMDSVCNGRYGTHVFL